MKKPLILIVDDNKMNRLMLSNILEEDYDIIFAENGKDALKKVSKTEVSVILLDLNMPKMNGYDFLKELNKREIIHRVAVILISGEEDLDKIMPCFDLGIYDYIKRPFDLQLVRKRVHNAYLLYENKEKLFAAFLEQVYSRQKEMNTLLSIFSYVLGYNSNESKDHILNVTVITNILLETLRKTTNSYSKLSTDDIKNIALASALHDIGKITVDDDILHKPDKLTEEEYSQIKLHPVAGALIISDPGLNQEDPVVKYTYEICRWHHERWDGSGYPDGLVGNDIPLSAQIVGLADSFDTMTHDSCYKKGIDFDTAVKRILNEESYKYNPMILKAFKSSKNEIKKALNKLHSIEDISKTTFITLAMDILNKK